MGRKQFADKQIIELLRETNVKLSQRGHGKDLSGDWDQGDTYRRLRKNTVA